MHAHRKHAHADAHCTVNTHTHTHTVSELRCNFLLTFETLPGNEEAEPEMGEKEELRDGSKIEREKVRRDEEREREQERERESDR